MPRFTYLAMMLAIVLPAVATHAAACPDLDGNDAVDQTDLLTMLSNWGTCSECDGDFNQSGQVDIDDLLVLLTGWGPCPNDGGGLFNYGHALQTALLFYEAQRSGSVASDSRLPWRGDSFMNAGMEQVFGDYDVDLRQRYMDAGDSPTFVLPISSAMTMLSWSAIEYPGGYASASQRDELERTLRWHADWCIEAHPEPNVFCGQIGQGDDAHAYWLSAEVYPTTYTPKAWWLTPDSPGSEPPAESAAFLAAASMVFADADPDYAQTLLSHAIQLHTFADQYQGLYHETITNVASAYQSWSGFYDELCWSALWLYRATGDDAWLTKSRTYYDTHFLNGTKQWTHNWDDKTYGCMILLATLTGDQAYRDEATQWLDYWTIGNSSGQIQYTPGGLAWLSTWGSLRYAANTAFLAMVYVDRVGDAPDGRYLAFAEKQINYALGDNPRSSSYVCGFGTNPPLRPHHRTAHGSWNNNIQDAQPNRHTLWGALVGGPASADDFDWADDRGDWIANEVACDYNAGFTAALARMSQTYGGDALPASEFPPSEDSYGLEMFVEAAIIEDTDALARVRCVLNNRSAWPARSSNAMSYRIYLNLSEVLEAGYFPEDVSITNSGSAATTGPHLADATTSLYYIAVDYSGDTITPGPGTSYLRDTVVSLSLPIGAPAAAWNINNDPSLAELPYGQANITKAEMIAVFDSGAHVYGETGTMDCNDNGIDDADEIDDGTVADLDGNGVPDECDADCDGNALPDAYEIAQGAPDCNGNGVPDTCDLANGNSTDQNDDDIPDECQLDGLGWRFDVADQWDGGFTASLIIENHTGADISTWQLEFDVAYEITGLWPMGASLWSQDAQGHVSVQNESWNALLPNGGLIEIGFQASGNPAAPTNVLLNGSTVNALP
jgi:endoglucanase